MDNIWITNADCTNCKQVFQAYNFTETQGTELGTTAAYKNEVFNLEIEGPFVSDKLIIEDSEFEVEFPIVVADEFIDVLGIAMDGIIGLGKNESSIVYKMYNDGNIDKPIYSLSFLNEPYLVLGTPNFTQLGLVVSEQEHISIQHPLNISFFSFGEFVDTTPMSIEFSSFSSYITGPFTVLEGVFKTLVDEGCHYEEELLMCECEDGGYSMFTFNIQGKNFSIGPEHYLITVLDR
jgi:hypothetical protein